MKIIKIIWMVLRGLATLAIFGGMLGVANTSFEKVVVAGLGVIYVSINFYGTAILRAQLGIGFQTTEQFHRLIRLVNNSTDLEYEEATLKNSIDEVSEKNTEYFIDMILNSLIWLISMFAIFTAL